MQEPASHCGSLGRDDLEFGHRPLTDEAGDQLADRTARQVVAADGWWPAFGRTEAVTARRPARVHDKLCTMPDQYEWVRQQFIADGSNRLWCAAGTQAGNGRLYLREIRDVSSNSSSRAVRPVHPLAVCGPKETVPR